MEIEKKEEEINGSVKERIDKLAEAVTNKLGVSAEEILKDFETEREYIKENLSIEDPKIIDNRAWVRFKTRWQKELRSDLPMFEGVILSRGSTYDALRNVRQTAEDKYKENPEKAVEEVYVDDEGNPLDWRKKFSNGNENRNYGNKLPDNQWKCNIKGVFVNPAKETEPQKFVSTLNGDSALDSTIPLYTPVRFRGKQPDVKNADGIEIINIYDSSTFIPFDCDYISADDILKSDMMDDEYIQLGEIKDLHPDNMGYYDYYATEGDVTYVSIRPNPKTGNKRVVITSDEFDADEINVWVPKHLAHLVDFDIGSRVWVYGTVSESTYNDEVTYNMNADGIYAFEDYKLPLNMATDGEFVETY